MVITKDEIVPVRSSEDIVRVRQAVRNWAIDMGFGLVDQTKLVTAASELARNTVNYGGGGTVRMGVLNNGSHVGLQLTFEDHGPGIADVELALRDGYTTGSGLGLGLGGARRLANEFEIDSHPGEGTRVRIIRWT
ncbi:MAG TPA: anti-sigma regulatory factor [Rubrobacter sp.]|nr:anti-sigma regulatory factor [Rubrobacter sp.]